MTARPFRKTILVTATALVLASTVAACSARKDVRGNYLTDTQLSTIQVGTTNQKTILRVLGPPSTQGTFDQQVWYYIGRQTESWAFFEPDVLGQRVVAVFFDERGVVEHVEEYGHDDARTVEVVDRETPTSGHSIGFFEQILGNIGLGGLGG